MVTCFLAAFLNFIDDCTIDDCMIDDGCVTEESYDAGTFVNCFSELNIQLINYSVHYTNYHFLITVETLQVGFTQSTATVNEDARMVTLTIEINQNSWVTRPVTVTYSTSEAVGATNAASKFYISFHRSTYYECVVFHYSKQC